MISQQRWESVRRLIEQLNEREISVVEDLLTAILMPVEHRLLPFLARYPRVERRLSRAIARTSRAERRAVVDDTVRSRLQCGERYGGLGGDARRGGHEQILRHDHRAEWRVKATVAQSILPSNNEPK